MKHDFQIVPYLTFNGVCREAMEFYQQIFGGQLDISYFGEMYDELPETERGKVMHARLQSEQLTLMASDTVPGNETTFGDNVSTTVLGTDSQQLAAVFEKLSQDGSVYLPYGMQAWGQELGMLTDKFGTHWMVSTR